MKKSFFLLMIAVSVLAMPALAQTPNSSGSYTQFSSSYRQPKKMDRSYICQVQENLRDRGLYKGPINGEIDYNTTEAIKAYQRSTGNQPTGQLTTTTLENMGIALPEPDHNAQDESDATVRRNMRSNQQ